MRQQGPKDSRGSDGSAYSGSEDSIDSDSDHDAAVDEDFTMNVGGARSRSKILQPTNGHQNTEQHYAGPDCGLCGQRHESGQCLMVDRSENLAEYREMLILHADDEPWEERVWFLLQTCTLSLTPRFPFRVQPCRQSMKSFINVVIYPSLPDNPFTLCLNRTWSHPLQRR